MNYAGNLKNFFGNAANTIKAKIAQLNPINRFIKFSLEQLFQQLIKDQKISYQSLMSGIIELPNLQLDIDKINQKYFFASPYALHSGTIGHLKIKLPSFTQIDKQNIEVQIKKIHLNFKPIQNFEENFKKIMEEIQEFMYHFVHEQTTQGLVVQNGSHDYFKETLRQLLANMKIRIQDIAVSVHSQNPETSSDSFLVFLKVPMINVHRGSDLIKKQKEVIQQMNFDCQIPQFALHLMQSQVTKHETFPFLTPDQKHSSAFLMFGISEFKNLKIETDERVPRINVSIWIEKQDKKVKQPTNQSQDQKQEKKVRVSVNLPKVQFSLDPSQIKMITLFMKQLNSFNERLKAVKNELGIDDRNQSQSLSVSRLKRKESKQKKNSEMFSRMSMSLLESSILNLSKVFPKVVKENYSPDVVDSILQKNKMQSNGELFQSIQDFNSFMEQSISQNGEKKPQADQVRMVSYKETLEVNASIDSVLVCIQKYDLHPKTSRVWNTHKEWKYPDLRNSYFIVSLQVIRFHLKDDKSIKASLSDFKLEHVKYRPNPDPFAKIKESQIQEDNFCDLRNTKHFYEEAQESMNKNDKPEHYCIEQILSISHSNYDPVSKQNIKRNDFIGSLKTNYENKLYKQAILFQSLPPNILQNLLKYHVNRFTIMDLSLSINTEIVKELLDLYCLIEKEVSTVLENKLQKPNQSMKGDGKNEKKCDKENQIVILTVRQVVFGFFDKDLKGFRSSTEKYMDNVKQEFQTCFCDSQERGIYGKVQVVDLRKDKQNKKLSFNSLNLGLIKVNNDGVGSESQLIKVTTTMDQNNVERLFQLSYQDEKPDIPSKILLICPQVLIAIDESETLEFIDIIYGQLQKFQTQLKSLLKPVQKPKSLDQQQSKPLSQPLKPIIKLYIENLNIIFLNLVAQIHQVYCSKQASLVTLKFSNLVLALRDSIEFYTAQMQNQKPILSPCQKNSKYSNIANTNIAFQFIATKSHQLKCAEQKMHIFLQKIHKVPANFQLTAKNSFNSSSSTQSALNMNSSKFAQLNQGKFIDPKAPKFQNIKSQIQIYEVALSAPLSVNAVILTKVIQGKEKYELFIHKIRCQIKKLIDKVNQVFPQNDSKKPKISQTISNKEFIISDGKVNIDIRPSFIQSSNSPDHKNLKTTSQRLVFSNTRSVFQINWEKSKFIVAEKKSYFNGSFNLKCYFKHSASNQHIDSTQISDEQLKNKNYIELLKVQKINYSIQMIQKKIRTNFQIMSISFESDIEKLAWMSLHFKQFLYHNVKRNLGFTLQQYEDRTVELKVQNQELAKQNNQIVNLSNAAQIYTERDKRKKQFETKFMGERFTREELDEKCQFYMEFLSINCIKLKLKNKQKTESCIDILVKDIRISAKIPEFSKFSLRLYGSISEIKIVHENIKQEGWLSSYLYANCYGKFTVLESHGKIEFIMEKDEERTYLKFDRCPFDIGFRSVILDLSQAYTSFKQNIQKSGWKKVYEEIEPLQKKEGSICQNPLILVSIPQNTINVSLIYSWYTVLSKRTVEAPKFLLHEQTNMIGKINQCVIDWVKSLCFNNISGLIGGALMQSFNLVVDQIVKLVGFLLSCFF